MDLNRTVWIIQIINTLMLLQDYELIMDSFPKANALIFTYLMFNFIKSRENLSLSPPFIKTILCGKQAWQQLYPLGYASQNNWRPDEQLSLNTSKWKHIDGYHFPLLFRQQHTETIQLLGNYIFLNIDFLYHKRRKQPNQSYYTQYVLTHEIYHVHERLTGRTFILPSGPDKPSEDPKIVETVIAFVHEHPQYLPPSLGGAFNFQGDPVVKRFQPNSLRLESRKNVDDYFKPRSVIIFRGFSS
jgi:hypothetical protein